MFLSNQTIRSIVFSPLHTMNFLRPLLLALVALMMTSCEKVIDYPLRETDEKIVVEALVTDQPGPYTVKISGTVGYLANGASPARDADLVTITDVEAGVTDTLDRTAAGIYQTTPKLGVGKVNHTYRLLIVRGNQRIEGTSLLRPCTPLDSISFKRPDEFPSGANPDTMLVTTIFFKEPAGRGDYYRVNMYRNNVWRNRKELFFFDDELYDGQYGDPVINGYNSRNGDVIRIEMFSLTKANYDFINGLATSQFQGGTPFDSPPANAPTNLSGGVLGFFSTCQVRIVSRVVGQ
jgi:hypothetical protein